MYLLRLTVQSNNKLKMFVHKKTKQKHQVCKNNFSVVSLLDLNTVGVSLQ